MTRAQRLTAPITVLLVAASVPGLAGASVYAAESAFVRPQLVAQDLFDLAIALPLLLWSANGLERGSLQKTLVWLGTLGYLAYSFATYAFNLHHNALFLVYVALLSTTTYALVAGVLAFPRERLAGAAAKAPLKLAGSYMVAVGALFAIVWLADIVISLAAGRIPRVVEQYGVPTFAPYILDLGFVLPALVWGGLRTTRRDPAGLVVGGLMLVMMALMMTQLGTGNAYLGLITGHVDWAFLGLFSGLAVATTIIAVIAGATLGDAEPDTAADALVRPSPAPVLTVGARASEV
jgi:hypothetical protein